LACIQDWLDRGGLSRKFEAEKAVESWMKNPGRDKVEFVEIVVGAQELEAPDSDHAGVLRDRLLRILDLAGTSCTVENGVLKGHAAVW
jgi:hypothetical protein